MRVWGLGIALLGHHKRQMKNERCYAHVGEASYFSSAFYSITIPGILGMDLDYLAMIGVPLKYHTKGSKH